MIKNTAGQYIGFQAISSSDGETPVTSPTPTIYYTIDGGTQGTCANTAVHKGFGQWTLDLEADETDGDHIVYTFVLTGAVTQCVNVYTTAGAAYTYLTTNLGALGANATAAGGDGSQFTEITDMALSTTAGNNLEDAFNGTGYAFTNCTIPWNSAWDAEVQSEVDDGVTANASIVAITASTGGGSGSTLRTEIERIAGVREWTIYGDDELFSAEAGDGSYATWPCVLKYGDTYYMYYTAKVGGVNVIRRRTSADGETSWTNDTTVLTGDHSYDEGGAWCPIVWVEDGLWYMIYTGANDGVTTVTGNLATSPNGTDWTESTSNPILEDEYDWQYGQVEPTAAIKVGSTYYVYFCNLKATGQTQPIWARRIGYASGTSLTALTTHSTPIFGDEDQSYASQPFIGYYGPYVWFDDFYYMICARYGPHGDYSTFELWESEDPTFLKYNRRHVSDVMTTHDDGTFPDNELDICCLLTDDIERNSFAASGNEAWLYFGAKHAGTWTIGLAQQDDMTEALRGVPSIINRIRDHLPQTRWNYAAVNDLFAGKLTEDYAAQGASEITVCEMMNELFQCIVDRRKVDTTMTTYKRDGTTPAVTYTLDDADNPTDISRDQS